MKLTLSGGKPGVVEADVVLVAIGATGNTEGLIGPGCKLEIERSRVKVDPHFKTNLENVYAVGDCVMMQWPEKSGMTGYRHPDLAHVAHHEAIAVVEAIAGKEFHGLDYRQIPGCTYTHPQVASMGFIEKKARESAREIKIGKFPFNASGRAKAAGETDGFVKLICDKTTASCSASHDRRKRHRAAGRAGPGPQAGGDRSRNHRGDPPAPDVQRSSLGSGRRGGWAAIHFVGAAG